MEKVPAFVKDPNVKAYPEKCTYGTCALEAADGGD